MRAIFLLGLLMLVACQTPYQEANNADGGVSAYQIGYDRYRIAGSVNESTSMDVFTDYMMLRASETALANGSRYFTIDSISDGTTAQTYVMPGPIIHTGYGNYVAMPTTAGVNIRPGGSMIIRLVSARSSSTFDAQEIVDTVGRRVQRG